MNYTAAVTDFFKSPKWLMNLLLAGVVGLIPVIGQMVIKGWLIGGFWGRDDERPETFPDFDFNKFGKYLERGVWPVLVTMASSAVLSLVIGFVAMPFFLVTGFISAGSHHNSCVGAILFLFALAFYLVLAIGIAFVLTPLVLRACLTQDFVDAFNFPFVKRFVRLMWKEILLASLFLILASLVLTCIGVVALCVGIIFVSVIIYFCWLHLDKQLYRLYLSRGGEPIPVSPKLRDDVTPATL